MTLDVAGILSPLREMIFGILIVAFLMFEPQALLGLVLRALGRDPAPRTMSNHNGRTPCAPH